MLRAPVDRRVSPRSSCQDWVTTNQFKSPLMSVNTQRWTVHFSGRVQGVGFRASTEHLAAGFAVTGYVRNLFDGRVELVAEGTEQELRQFLDEIRARLGQYIRQQTQTSDPASGEWDDFAVRY